MRSVADGSEKVADELGNVAAVTGKYADEAGKVPADSEKRER